MSAGKLSVHSERNYITRLPQRMERRLRWILSNSLLLSLLLTALPLAIAQQEAGKTIHGWPAKVLMAGSPQTKGTIEIRQSAILLNQEKGQPLEIPINKVAEIIYDNSSHSKSREWLHAAGGIAETPFVIVPYPVAAALVGAAFAAPFKTRSHLVRILWNDAEKGSLEVLLEIGKRDYASVLAELQSRTGKRWRDWPEERKKRLEELQSGGIDKQSFTLEQPILVNDVELKPGKYAIVVLPRPQDAGEVYFYRCADLNPDHIVAQAIVQIEKRSGAQPSVTPLFATASDAKSIAALEMSDETLRFPARAVPPAVESAARSFYGGRGRWAIVTRTSYKGEPALRFSLGRQGKNCTTFVNVSRERFALDGSCNELDVTRGEVKATTLGKSNDRLKVTVNGKSWIFWPIFEFLDARNSSHTKISVTTPRGIAAREFSKFFVRTVTDFDAVERETAANSPSGTHSAHSVLHWK